MNILALATFTGTSTRTTETLRDEMFRTAKIAGQIKQLGVIAKFLQDIDSFQWLRIVATKKSLYLGRLDEQSIQFQLEV